MKSDNDVEKQICILKMEQLNNQYEADLFIYHLTGHHGLIREATAIKLSEFITEKNYSCYFLNDNALESILDAVNDINPNICRLMCSSIPSLFNNAAIEQKSKFIISLYSRLDVIFEELEKLKRSNWYTKKLFHLYWALEALAVLSPNVDDNLESVLNKAVKIRDYTIREKAAYVISTLSQTSSFIEELKMLLKEDENFYVQRFSKGF